jgi:hypothetical protein
MAAVVQHDHDDACNIKVLLGTLVLTPQVFHCHWLSPIRRRNSSFSAISCSLGPAKQ